MEYKLIRSGRRTLAVEISRKGEIIVRAPYMTSIEQIENFIESNRSRIEKAVEREKRRTPSYSANEPEAQGLRQLAEKIIPPKVEYFSNIMGVTPESVRITSAQKRFGSCSSRGHICFSFNLVQYSDDLIDYVVVHELSHLVELNHSRRFWKIVEKYIPDYKERRERLRE